MKILIGIPVVTGAEHCGKAICSVLGWTDTFVISNGADEDVIDMLSSLYKTRVAGFERLNVVSNEKNVYVNAAWNQIINHFLQNDYDYLVIMNSDLTMKFPWHYICKERWAKDPNEILIPNINPDKEYDPYPYYLSAKVVSSGTPGVFITLNRKQAEIVYPIPEEIKIWFGDQFIYEVLRGLGYKTVVVPNLIGTTSWSQTIAKVPEAPAIIEEDKKQWELIKHRVELKIKQYKDENSGNCLSALRKRIFGGSNTSS